MCMIWQRSFDPTTIRVFRIKVSETYSSKNITLLKFDISSSIGNHIRFFDEESFFSRSNHRNISEVSLNWYDILSVVILTLGPSSVEWTLLAVVLSVSLALSAHKSPSFLLFPGASLSHSVSCPQAFPICPFQSSHFHIYSVVAIVCLLLGIYKLFQLHWTLNNFSIKLPKKSPICCGLEFL